MLQRVLEPEVMDTVEEARDYDAMDHTAVNAAFVSDFLMRWSGVGEVLDVGTGTAQVPIALCQRLATVRVVGVDLAVHMLSIGNENVCRAGLRDRVTLERCDAKRLPYADCRFAAVMSNSIVHHIPEPSVVLGEMIRVLQPGGWLFVRDLMRPEDDAMLQHLVATYAAGANAHQRQLFAQSLHAALTLDEVRDRVEALGYCPAEVQQTSDRHWTWCTCKRGPNSP